MAADIQIHPELRSVKAHTLPTNRWALAALQRLLRLINSMHRRRFKRLLTRTLIRSADGHRVPILVIKPESPQPSLSALVYFHGGAFVMEGAPPHLENAVRYAGEANCAVIFVQYRLAPQNVFPAALNDCHAALLWTVANATALGIDATRIAVGGDSAGGNLAAAVAQRALREDHIPLRGQMLLYPAVDLLCTRPSMTSFKDVPPFRDLSAGRIAQTYLGCEPSRPLPRYSSPIEEALTGLSPAYVEVPQFDPLHDQGVDYAKMLQAACVSVELNDIPGAIHGFDLLAPNSGVSRDAMNRRIRFLNGIFSDSHESRA